MQCPACYGPLIWMGRLGNLTHVKCRNCGLEATAPPGAYHHEEDGEDDED